MDRERCYATFVYLPLLKIICRHRRVKTIGGALWTAIGKQSGENSGVWTFKNAEELVDVDRTGAHGVQTNRTWLLSCCSALKNGYPLVGC